MSRPAPTAEFPIEDLDVEVLIESGLSTPEEGFDGFSCWRLERPDDPRRPCVVRGEQLAVDNQALARQTCEVGQQRSGWLLAPVGEEVRDHHKARLDRPARKVPHCPAQQVR